MTQREEIAIVKKELKKAGIPFKKVRHGTGSASWWLKIYLKNGEDEDRKVIQIAQKATGRFGLHDGRIAVFG